MHRHVNNLLNITPQKISPTNNTNKHNQSKPQTVIPKQPGAKPNYTALNPNPNQTTQTAHNPKSKLNRKQQIPNNPPTNYHNSKSNYQTTKIKDSKSTQSKIQPTQTNQPSRNHNQITIKPTKQTSSHHQSTTHKPTSPNKSTNHKIKEPPKPNYHTVKQPANTTNPHQNQILDQKHHHHQSSTNTPFQSQPYH